MKVRLLTHIFNFKFRNNHFIFDLQTRYLTTNLAAMSISNKLSIDKVELKDKRVLIRFEFKFIDSNGLFALR